MAADQRWTLRGASQYGAVGGGQDDRAVAYRDRIIEARQIGRIERNDRHPVERPVRRQQLAAEMDGYFPRETANHRLADKQMVVLCLLLNLEMRAIGDGDAGRPRIEVGPEQHPVRAGQTYLNVQTVEHGVPDIPRIGDEAGAVVLVRMAEEQQRLIDRFNRPSDLFVEHACEIRGIFYRAPLRCVVFVPQIEADTSP